MEDWIERPDLAAVLHSVAAPIVVYDREYRFAYANPAFCASVHKTWEELAGRPATHVDFYEILGGFQFCLVMCKLAEMYTLEHGAEAVYLGLTAGYSASAADFATFGAVAPEDFHQAAVARTEELLDEAMVHAEGAGVLAHRFSSQPNADARSVVESARRRRCDLIVVGADNHNAVVRLLNGSLLPGLITASTVPLLICKQRIDIKFQDLRMLDNKRAHLNQRQLKCGQISCRSVAIT